MEASSRSGFAVWVGRSLPTGSWLYAHSLPVLRVFIFSPVSLNSDVVQCFYAGLLWAFLKIMILNFLNFPFVRTTI